VATTLKSATGRPFVDSRGRAQIERRGLPRKLGSTLATDGYHFLRTTTWTAIMLLFAGVFIGTNLIAATVLWLGHADVVNATGFIDYFWFSVQTLATIGYGYLYPNDTLSHVMVTVESFFGIGLTALVTGIFFARFSTPSARVLFSERAIIADYEGKPTLMFRMANARATAIVEATIHVYISRDEVLSTGERVRRIYDLALRRNNSPIFFMTWTAYHVIDETSPLFGKTRDQLDIEGTNVIITFTGIDDRLAATVHTRYAYNMNEIVFDHRFADVIKNDAVTGARYLDFAPFHETEPLR
jgi:inward rectifier potassium channel